MSKNDCDCVIDVAANNDVDDAYADADNYDDNDDEDGDDNDDGDYDEYDDGDDDDEKMPTSLLKISCSPCQPLLLTPARLCC